MDAFSRYNQIHLHLDDQRNTSFITEQDLYCYQVMPFGLKTAGATHQHLVNHTFNDLIRKSMEVYVDDMLVKIQAVEDHVSKLQEAFQVPRKYKIKINPMDCAFRVSSRKFLGFMMSQRRIKANSEKIWALMDSASLDVLQHSIRLYH